MRTPGNAYFWGACKITGPRGLNAVERIVRSAGFEVSDDLWDFEWAYGLDPPPGLWKMEIQYIYEKRPDAPNAWAYVTFITVAKLKLEMDVAQCLGGACAIYASDERPLEGTAGEVYIHIVNPDPWISYSWNWRLGFLTDWDIPGNGPANPNMRSSPSGTYISVRPKWVAWPDVMVADRDTKLKQRYTHSRYVFGLPAAIGFASEVRITPQVPWGTIPLTASTMAPTKSPPTLSRRGCTCMRRFRLVRTIVPSSTLEGQSSIG